MRYKPEISRLSGIHLLTLTIAVLFSSHSVLAEVGPDWIEQWGITWTFDKNLSTDGVGDTYHYGTFANGDYWICNPNTGPVNIIIISPNPVQVAQDSQLFWMDGSQANPANLGAGPFAPGSKQALDQRLEAFWDEDELVTASVNSPYAMLPNTSLITAISWRLGEPGAPSLYGAVPHMLRPSLKTAAILTCLSQAPAEPLFRPAYCGTGAKVLHPLSAMDLSVLPRLRATSGVPDLSNPTEWQNYSNYLSRPWIDFVTAWQWDGMHPSQNMPNYGREMSQQANDIILLTMLDSNTITDEQRQTLAIQVIQLGIDNHGIVTNGGAWGYIGGGVGHGRKAPILYAGAMLDYTDYKNIGITHGQNNNRSVTHLYFMEDTQKFYTTQDDIDYYNVESRRATRTNCRVDASDPSLIIDDDGSAWYLSDDGVTQIPSRPAQDCSDYWLIWNYGTGSEEYVRILSVGPAHMMRLRDPVTPSVGVTARVTLYPQGRLGMPDWAGGMGWGGHWNNRKYDWYSRAYRTATTGNSLAGAHLFALAVSTRDGTPLKTLWNWDPFFDYMDMYMNETHILGWQRVATSPFAESMWDTYRADNGPVWPNQSGDPILDPIGNKSVGEDELLTFTATATDPEDDPITYSVQNLPAGATFTSQAFSWTPTHSDAGEHQVTFVASDGQFQDSETITITVGYAPVLAAIGPKSVDENTALTFTVNATDGDGNIITYSAGNLPDGADFDIRTGAFDWTPASGQAKTKTYSVTFTATDGVYTDSETILITVNPRDDDGDGLPDFWEMQYFPDLSQGPQDDPDTDGLTNLQEYTGGTDPTVFDDIPPDIVYSDSSTSSFYEVDSFVQIPTSGMSVDGGTIALSAYAEDLSVSRYLFGHTVGTWSNRIQLYIRDGNLGLGLGDTNSRHTNISSIQLRRWYHVVLTWNGSSYAVYVDGSESATGTYSGLTQLNDFADIGNTGNPSWRDQEAFSGVIDDVRIYNRALNADEVLELYNNASDDPTHTVTFIEGGNGSIGGTLVQVIDHGSDCSQVDPAGNANYHFENWTGDYTGTDDPLTITNVTADMTIQANFAIDQKVLTTSSSANGSVTTPGESGPYNYDYGTNAAIEATHSVNYHFVNWTGSGVTAGKVANPGSASTTITMDDNYSVQANFAIDTFTVNYAAGLNGHLTGDTAQVIDYGSDATAIIAVPDTGSGYHFVNWSDASTDNPRTDTNVTAAISVTAVFEQETASDPVAWYKFDEGYGNSAQDSSGIGNTGALVGAAWTTEDGLSFNGTDDYVEVPDSDSLDIQNKITLSLWVKLNAYDTDWPKLITKPYQSADDPWELYTLDLGHYGSTPRLIITDGISGGDGAVAADSGYTISLNEWHHIAGTYDGSLMSVYVDGNLIATQAADFQIGTNDMPLSIGGRLGVNSFNGFIDEVQIYNRSLTGQEVIELYKQNTLKARYKLDTYSGLNAPDSSGNDNTATLANGPSWTGAGELKLDGIDDYVDCGSGASSNLTGDLTVTAWVYPDSFGAGPLAGGLGRIVDRHGNLSGFAFYVKEEIQGLAYLTYAGPFVDSDSDVIDLAQWQHVAVTYSDASDTVTFYVNGQPAGGGNYQTNPNDSANAPLIIGNRAASDRGFEGMLSDVRIYSRTLADDEISTIYRTYEFIEAKNLCFEVSTTDSDDYVAQDPMALPAGATFTDNIFTWRTWYNQAGSYEITFEVPGQPDYTQSVPMVVENVSLKPWYRNFLEMNDKY